MNTTSAQVVNAPPTGSVGLGHNKPPEPLTAKLKIERIEALIERNDLTAAQKCIGVGIVVKADREGVAEAKTQELMDFASVKDRETVFRATKVLHRKEIVEKANKPGQPGRYNVLPPRVIEAIIAAHAEQQTGRVKPDGHDAGTGQAKPDGIEGVHPVGSEPTTQVEPVGFEPTGWKPSRARIEPPSGVNISLENSKLARDIPVAPRELAGLNGSADPMISDILGWMGSGTEINARQWLSTFVQQFGQEAVRNSYMKLKTDVLSGSLVGKPLQTWTKIAQRMKAEPAQRTGRTEPAGETRRDRFKRYIEEAQAKKEPRPS